MGEFELSYISDILYEHMIIGLYFFTHPHRLTVDMLDKFCEQENLTKLPLHTIIADLVSHGIISADINNGQNICYYITEFGQYFFEEFFQANSDAKELCEKVRGYVV